MNTLIATDVRISKFNNRLYIGTQVSIIFKRYYNFFGKFILVCRVKEITELSSAVEDVTDYISDIIKIPSLTKLLLHRYDEKLKKVIPKCDLVICRCPTMIGNRAAKIAKKNKIPYFTENMGCAWDGLWNHGIAGKIIAPFMFFNMKKTVKNSSYALYVTSEFLQKRYPCKCESIGVSNVVIQKQTDDILERRLQKVENMKSCEISLMTTAAVNVRYKGQQFVIKAIPKLNKLGIKVKYHLVGGGDNTYLKKLVKKLNVENQVIFEGRKTLNEVFELLDSVDVYIQPSLQEGLPRSLVEAMSRGCIAIGAKTAGIPELLQDEFIVKRKSVTDIVKVVSKISQNSVDENKKIAERNFEFARNFDNDILTEKRNNYFEKIVKDLEK